MVIVIRTRHALHVSLCHPDNVAPPCPTSGPSHDPKAPSIPMVSCVYSSHLTIDQWSMPAPPYSSSNSLCVGTPPANCPILYYSILYLLDWPLPSAPHWTLGILRAWGISHGSFCGDVTLFWCADLYQGRHDEDLFTWYMCIDPSSNITKNTRMRLSAELSYFGKKVHLKVITCLPNHIARNLAIFWQCPPTQILYA